MLVEECDVICTVRMVISVDGNTVPVTNTYLTHKIWRYKMDSTGSE